jgi:hypothetical protein
MIARAFLAMICLGIAANVSAAPPMRFDAHLTGWNAAGQPVDTNATGQAKVEIVDDGQAIYFQVEVAGIEGAVMAHIHVNEQPVQVNEPAGPPVYWFFGGPPPNNPVSDRINGSLARGYITSDGDLSGGTVLELVAAIKEGRASIIVHTQQNFAGELRGTLR